MQNCQLDFQYKVFGMIKKLYLLFADKNVFSSKFVKCIFFQLLFGKQKLLDYFIRVCQHT